jgi:hypothetical protein
LPGILEPSLSSQWEKHEGAQQARRYHGDLPSTAGVRLVTRFDDSRPTQRSDRRLHLGNLDFVERIGLEE